MHSLCLALIFAGLLPALSLAQLNCTALGFSDAEPTQGENLQRCSTTDEQCCSDEYIALAEATVVDQLRTYLQEEFDAALDSYQDDVENLLEFFDEEFLERFVDSLPGRGRFRNRSDASLANMIQDLANNYNIPEDDDENDEEDDDDDDENSDDNDDDRRKKRQSGNAFNPRDFVEALVEALEDSVAIYLSNGNGQARRCIREVANSAINGQAVANVARNIQVIRESVSSLIRIGAFLVEQREALAQATFVEECIATFFDLAFCSRCTQSTPPLCLDTCNTLLRACYSPYYTALNGQYSQLWDVAQQLIRIANTTVAALLVDEATLLDIEELEEELSNRCNIVLPEGDFDYEGVEKRSEDENGEETGETGETEEGGSGDDASGEEESSDSSDTTGDSDSSRGARGNGRVIEFGLVDDIFDLSGAFDLSEEGFQFCLRNLEDRDCTVANDPIYCEGTDVCTAECDCTTGDVLIDEGVLEGQAAVLAANDPVASFLTSSRFTSVAPEGVETGDSGEDDASAANTLIGSLTILLCTVLLAFI